jgi:hypothetical protein
LTKEKLVVEAVAFAAWSQWAHNGHDIPGALLHVHHNHVDASVREMAGEAYELVLRMPLVWSAYAHDFARREHQAHTA